MGAPIQDYLLAAPRNSFIHVDEFESPLHLARYLHTVAENDTLYNSYFQWKGTGAFINTKFWCRLCAMLNVAPRYPMWYEDLAEWWSGPGVCLAAKKTKEWSSWGWSNNTNKRFSLDSVSELDSLPSAKYGYPRHETIL